jgi:hypothetical protein
MNLDEWQPRSEYFKARRLRAIRWVERQNEREIRGSGNVGNAKGLRQVLADVEGQAQTEQGTALSGLWGGVGAKQAFVRGLP